MNTQALSGRDLAAALAVVVIWGLNFVAMKLALRDFTPWQLGAARYVFALVPLIFFVPRPKVPWRWLAAYGLAQGVGQFGLLFLGFELGMSSALASVLMQTQVFFTTIIAFFLLNERLTRQLTGGLVFAGLGLLCFAMSFLAAHDVTATQMTISGFVLTLSAAAMWGVSNIVARNLQRSNPGYNPFQFVVWSSLTPIVPFVMMSWVFDPVEAQSNWTNASVTGWLGVAYLGWLATITAYGLWTHLLKRHPANRVAPFSLGVPVIGLVAGMLTFGETIGVWQAIGVAFIGLSLFVVMFGARVLKLVQLRS
ncbi:EamA family transporter [Parazoarcus communis]|uniref:EamA family transporter n=1 Tax=Parazoarcus communis TaxID=41977 RepID=A0A2U8H5H1_9RHOO|nr:EamA family transporter [Parazoarcus communis]AWI81319.1 EamA family transporter [Parazoarcus communis]